MPELIDELYCSQQIVIPPKYPYILKQFAKSAIKTQPYDLLRWAYEYFQALCDGRKPPVKSRIEYPIYATEGGLTRGYLKVLVNQLEGMECIPLETLSKAWRGSCLDPCELTRLLCLCSVYKREESVNYLKFFGVACSMLTKNLTNTMILACETLTKEPDGGSAAIPYEDFLIMYIFLAKIDGSTSLRYHNGYLEGELKVLSSGNADDADGSLTLDTVVKDETENSNSIDTVHSSRVLNQPFHIPLIDADLSNTPRLSRGLTVKLMDKVDRCPSLERIKERERESMARFRVDKPGQDKDIDDKLKELSDSTVQVEGEKRIEVIPEEKSVGDSEPRQSEDYGVEEEERPVSVVVDPETLEKLRIEQFVKECYESRDKKRFVLECLFEELDTIADRFRVVNYDLSMVAGRQMSTTSGEFVVQYIEKQLMDYINEQIGILPDPDLKKKKARPEEQEMVRNLVEDFINDTLDAVCGEVTLAEEEEEEIPEITVICPIPGIGPIVEDAMIQEFVEYVHESAQRQEGLFMPRDLRFFTCPPLEKFEDEPDGELYKQET